jgi:hypothetical protein
MNKGTAVQSLSNGSTPIGPLLDQQNRLQTVGATVVDVVATVHDGEPVLGHMVPPGSLEIVAAMEQDGMDLPGTELVLLVRARLEQHPRFRGRSSLFTIELVGETIVMTGRFPSFYLKQLLQEVIKVMPGVVSVDNQVHVVWPNA